MVKAWIRFANIPSCPKKQWSDYNHKPAFRIFDMVKDDVVLIGKDYWDLLGGNGTYKKILEIADTSGVETKKIINQYIHTVC